MRGGQNWIGSTASYANRGMSFENMIEYSNNRYEAMGLALVNKRPTPVKVTGRFRGGEIKGYFERPSTVDYDGILLGGRSIVFEAKSVAKANRFDLKNVEPHQVEYLSKCHDLNGISFLLIEMQALNSMYLIPYITFKHYWNRRGTGRGSSSIIREELDVNAYEVFSGRVPVDYLKVVEQIWETGGAG